VRYTILHIKTLKKLTCFILLLTVMNACNITKNVPPDDKLYMGSKVKPKGKLDKDIKELLENAVTPRPNASFLGIKYRLLLYNLIKEPKKPKGFFYKVKHKWGEAPVLLSQVSPRATMVRFNNLLFGNGYLRPIITSQINTKKQNRATIQYNAEAGDRYTIDSIIFPSDSTAISRLVMQSAAQTLFKKGDYFNLAVMAAERERIDLFLKTKGYYYFVPDNLIIKTDTLHQGKAQLYVALKPGISPASIEPWKIGDIYIYGNYTLERDSAISKQKGRKEKNYVIVDKRNTYRSIVYDKAVSLKTGQLYNRNRHALSIERLMNLNTFRFVRMGFTARKDTTGADSTARDTTKNILDTRIYLSPARKQTVRLEISGNSKSNNFVGSELSLNYRNLNLLKGAEILEIKVTGGFDWQVGGRSQLSPNAQTLNAEVNFTIPRAPSSSKTNINRRGNPYLPRTFFSTSLEYLRRPDLYLLRSNRFAFGFNWKKRKEIENTLTLININAINPSNITPKFDSILNNDINLRSSFERQMIVGTNYKFTYNNTYRTNRRFNFIFNWGVGFSGWPALAMRKSADTSNSKKLFNIPLSQFGKIEMDITGYFNLNKTLTWVNRLVGGAALSFGTSSTVPYAEQFFTGGSSSLRAFRIRTLGPGSYHTDQQQFLANESGEIKAEFNTELRYDLVKYIKLAAFMDAGNIWLRKDAGDKPGSGLNGGRDLWKELAVGAGIGLRFDANVMVIRFDLAMPLRKPWYPEGKRWVLNEINFGNSTWRKENLILNIGIGYPF
jgi:outer membrane protein assembly factor BamA